MEFVSTEDVTCADAESKFADPPCAIFLRHEWFALFDKYVRWSDGQTLNLCLRDSGRTVAQLPVYKSRSEAFRGLHSLTNFYSPFFRMLGEGPLDASIHLAFVNKYRRYLTRFDRIDFVPVFESDLHYWNEAFSSIGFRGFSYYYSTNWYHDGITDFDAFWSARPTQLRNTVKRKSEKLAKQKRFSIAVVSPASKLELWEYLGHYHQVYYSSWKRAEPYPAFIDAVVEYAWKTGELRLGMAYFGDIPVAAQIWFVCGATAYIFKLAYRPEYSRYSVGTLLSKVMFEYVIEKDRVACIDYLTGNDRYKKDWMSANRMVYGLQLCNQKTSKGTFFLLRNTISKVSRSFIKRQPIKSDGSIFYDQ